MVAMLGQPYLLIVILLTTSSPLVGTETSLSCSSDVIHFAQIVHLVVTGLHFPEAKDVPAT